MAIGLTAEFFACSLPYTMGRVSDVNGSDDFESGTTVRTGGETCGFRSFVFPEVRTFAPVIKFEVLSTTSDFN